MGIFSNKWVIAAVLVLGVLGAGVFVLFSQLTEESEQTYVQPEEPKEEILEPRHSVIGTSVEGRPIEAFTYENGATHLLFVGGVHGGYEWNSVLLSYKFLDYLDANPDIVPESMTVTVVPSANPDGVYEVVGVEGRFAAADVTDETANGQGRFNAHDVDLNRNFDCKWAPESTWRSSTVSAGTEPFSEPEARAIRDLVLETDPVAVVFWHSQSNAVYASECEAGILPQTRDVMNAYAQAAGYPAVDSFDAYAITGDAEGWLASIGIPAITVELSTHETIEWERNLAGVKALFAYYGEEAGLAR